MIRADIQPQDEMQTMGVPLESFADLAALRHIAAALWDLLDDVDTASDRAKGNDGAYREIVERVQAKRRELMHSDGYNLFVRAGNDG